MEQTGTQDSNNATVQSSIYIPSTVKKEVQTTKRRSFTSRKSLCYNDLGENVSSMDMSDNQHMEESKPEKSMIEEFKEKLEIEKNAWKAMYEERRRKLKELKNSNRECLKLDWGSCADVLSDGDKTFLENKPDYERILSDFQKLEEIAALNAHMRHKTVHMSAGILNVAEGYINNENNKVLKHLTTQYSKDPH